jgi:dihydroxy-acid dehydratase
MADGGPTPRGIITRESVDNASRLLLAISGSTNAVIHLAAIAGRLGIHIDPDHFNALSDTTPVLVNLKPVGDGYMEDFHEAGGVGAVMRELRDLLHPGTRDVTGQTLGERLREAAETPRDDRYIKSKANPVDPLGGLIFLRGSLAPGGAVLKRAAATPPLMEHEGRAVVFSSLEDLAARIDDPALDVEANDILVLQNAGPKSPAAMPEAGYLPIPRKLAAQGVKDMIRISDARMSGTAFGTVVLHVSPEAAAGGPLSLVRTGDRIKLSASAKSLDLMVPVEELSKRGQPIPPSPPARGYARLHTLHVLPASEGCDLDFLARRESD